jgi:multidrug efflux system membrane fusion protein
MTATRDRDQAQLVNAQANLNRYTPLESKGYATPQLVDTQKAQVAQLQNAVKADEALIEAAKVQLSFTRLSRSMEWSACSRFIVLASVSFVLEPPLSTICEYMRGLLAEYGVILPRAPGASRRK